MGVALPNHTVIAGDWCMTSFETKKVKVLDLLLWDENSRLPDKLSGRDQFSIRQALLSDEKRFEVKSFAKEIVKDFDLPQLEKIVVIDEDEGLIAYEGNRRVLAYQCLIKPELAGEYQNDFRKLATSIDISDDFELECVITKDFHQANRYIERKHLNNNNEKSWGQYERDNHSVRVKRFGGNADKERIKRANIGKLVEETELPEEMKRKILGPGYVTNFYRIVDSSPGYNYFGFTVDDVGDLDYKNKDDLLLKLKVFIYELLTKKPASGQSWSRAYNSNQEKEEYLSQLDLSDSKAIDQTIEDSKTKNLLGEEELTLKDPKGKSLFTRSKEKEYPTLVKLTSKRLLIGDKSKKIDEIYKELQHVIVKDCPHAVSVLLRTLAEITIKRFLEVHGEQFTKEGALIVKEGKPRSELKQKIVYIAETYAGGDIKASMLALNEDLFTQSLNQVVHNIGYFATEKQVRDFWKNLNGVFEFLVEGIIEKENDTNKNT